MKKYYLKVVRLQGYRAGEIVAYEEKEAIRLLQGKMVQPVSKSEAKSKKLEMGKVKIGSFQTLEFDCFSLQQVKQFLEPAENKGSKLSPQAEAAIEKAHKEEARSVNEITEKDLYEDGDTDEVEVEVEVEDDEIDPEDAIK